MRHLAKILASTTVFWVLVRPGAVLRCFGQSCARARREQAMRTGYGVCQGLTGIAAQVSAVMVTMAAQGVREHD
jgi:hypothetical protein